jgi:hypothetical protein
MNSPKMARALVSLSMVFGAQHAGSQVEIGAQRPAELGRGDNAEPGVSGRWASFAALLGGHLDHARFEQEPA